MSTAIKIVKINPVRSGLSAATKKPYDWHTAECFLLDDAGQVVSVGEMVFPFALREALGGVPPLGTYRAVISLVAFAGEIKPQITNLVPIAI